MKSTVQTNNQGLALSSVQGEHENAEMLCERFCFVILHIMSLKQIYWLECVGQQKRWFGILGALGVSMILLKHTINLKPIHH